nr:general odorant-binding protein 72-like isoform X1 [Metisa plana]
MKALIIGALIITLAIHDSFAMTRQQLKKTLTIVKNQCMPKTGVTEDEVGGIEQGNFLEKRNVMCYIACIYKNIQVVKNEKLNLEAVQKQVDILYPADMRPAVRAAIEKCTSVVSTYNDLCEMSYYAAKCLYEKDSENFVFP